QKRVAQLLDPGLRHEVLEGAESPDLQLHHRLGEVLLGELAVLNLFLPQVHASPIPSLADSRKQLACGASSRTNSGIRSSGAPAATQAPPSWRRPSPISVQVAPAGRYT